MLPARLKLPVPPGSDHQDFKTDILLAQSNLQIDAFSFLVVWLRFILICLNDLYLSGIWRLLALLWSAKNGTQNMGWWKRPKLFSGLQDISAFDYKQVCHNQGSPRSEENLYIRALIWYWDHLKNFIAEIPQGPLGMSIGTIWVTQKRSQGPPARGFWLF